MERNISSVRPSTFFLLTYLFSWIIWIPLLLAHFRIGPLEIPETTSGAVRLLGVLMPATAGIILTGFIRGREGIGSLFRRLLIWRVGLNWWAAAAFLQPGLLILAAFCNHLFNGQSPVIFTAPETVTGLIVNAIFLLIATLGEEIGWRGVALPALQARYSPLASATLLGLLWAAWHIPFWLLMDTFDQYGWMYLALNFLLLPLTFYLSWIFNHTRSSLLMPVIFHLTFNIVNTALLPVTANITAFTVLIVLEWIGAFWIIPHMAVKNSTRRAAVASLVSGS